jgi:hypothetical protein
MFVDPVADIAVLGSPDTQDLSEEAEAYDQLIDGAIALKIVDAPKMVRKRTRARVVSGHRIAPVTYESPVLTYCPARVVLQLGRGLIAAGTGSP